MALDFYLGCGLGGLFCLMSILNLATRGSVAAVLLPLVAAIGVGCLAVL